MSSVPIPGVVIKFLASHIATVPELEALLLLRETRSHAWTAEELGRRIYASPGNAAAILEKLCDARLVEKSGESHEFKPAPELEAVIAEVAHCYQKNLVEMTQLIHCGASQAVRDFARAFEFRKEK